MVSNGILMYFSSSPYNACTAPIWTKKALWRVQGYERLVTTECHYQPTAGEQMLAALSGMTSAVVSTS
jgi:hypothetical protein